MAVPSSSTVPYVSLSSIPAPTASACLAGNSLVNPPFNGTGCSINNISNHTLAMQACCAGAPIAAFGAKNQYNPSGDSACYLYCNVTTESTKQLNKCLIRLGVGEVECSGDVEKPDDPSYVGSTVMPSAAAAPSTTMSSMSTSATATGTAASATPTGGASTAIGSVGIGKGALIGITIVTLGSIVAMFA